MFPVIQIGPYLSIPTYVLTISFAYCLAIYWLLKRCQQQKFNFETSHHINLAIMFGGLIGARIFHILYEYPQFYWQHPENILKFWLGGFVFYGGAIGAGLTAIVVLLKKKEPIAPAFDFYAPVIAGTYALGRLACFFNGCCYGRICSLPWAIHFPGVDLAKDIVRHPTQIYASLWDLGLLLLLLWIERYRARPPGTTTSVFKRLFAPAGQLFLIWGILHGLGRSMMELLRDDPRGPQLEVLTVSMTISLLLSFVSAILFLKVLVGKKKPGLSSC